jgi:cyanocobalamin reductase (cyanide-eliminating) / alkylcobalamin dealkylase
MGVCLHPKYGGWFALRAVAIFKTLKYPLLPIVEPVDVFNGDESLIVDVLKHFNYDWQSNAYRNMIYVEDSYSPLQQSYFQTEPKNRLIWLENLRQKKFSHDAERTSQ